MKNILIYDDDKEILFLCKIILKKHNFHADTFTRCDDVIRDIHTFKPDFILMDLRIPDMGGEEAVKLVKSKEQTKNIPIFLFSANADIDSICKRVNADGYISKPFDIKTFISTIEKT